MGQRFRLPRQGREKGLEIRVYDDSRFAAIIPSFPALVKENLPGGGARPVGQGAAYCTGQPLA